MLCLCNLPEDKFQVLSVLQCPSQDKSKKQKDQDIRSKDSWKPRLPTVPATKECRNSQNRTFVGGDKKSPFLRNYYSERLVL